MIVGAALVELHVHDSHSLKQKRGVVRSVVARVRNRFNVSVAEVGGQDTWQRALIGVTATGIDTTSVRRTLAGVVDFVESLHLAEVRASDIEVIELAHGDASEDGDDEPLPWEEE